MLAARKEVSRRIDVLNKKPMIRKNTGYRGNGSRFSGSGNGNL